MHIYPTEIPEVKIIELDPHADDRGYLAEVFREDVLKEHGISSEFLQENQSVSSRHVLRGLHYQVKHPQAKLCRVSLGSVLDVAVDIRVGSPSFGKSVGVHLSSENLKMLYIPRGFAHGVLILEENTVFQYKCDDYYDASDSKGIIWNDPDLAIQWSIEKTILSESDQRLPTLANVPSTDLPVYQPDDHSVNEDY